MTDDSCYCSAVVVVIAAAAAMVMVMIVVDRVVVRGRRCRWQREAKMAGRRASDNDARKKIMAGRSLLRETQRYGEKDTAGNRKIRKIWREIERYER